MASPHAAFSELTISTWPHRMKNAVGQIVGHNAFYRKLDEKQLIEYISGGTEIEQPIYLNENNTITNFSGYDVNPIGSSETLTGIKVPLKSKWMWVSANGDELRRNNGPERMINLVDTRIQAAKESGQNHMSVELHGDGATKSSLWGLQAWITPAASMVGGIDAAVYRNWDNQRKEMAGTNAWQAAIRAEFSSLMDTTEFDAEKTDLIIAANDIFNAYEVTVQNQMRYEPTYMNRSEAEGGVVVMRHREAEIVRDSNANFATNAERAYFLNTRHWKLIVHKDAKWDPEAPRTPIDQDAVGIPFLYMGNAYCKSRRTQGLLFDAA